MTWISHLKKFPRVRTGTLRYWPEVGDISGGHCGGTKGERGNGVDNSVSSDVGVGGARAHPVETLDI